MQIERTVKLVKKCRYVHAVRSSGGYDTAEKFNEFYRECHVVGDPLQVCTDAAVHASAFNGTCVRMLRMKHVLIPGHSPSENLLISVFSLPPTLPLGCAHVCVDNNNRTSVWSFARWLRR